MRLPRSPSPPCSLTRSASPSPPPLSRAPTFYASLWKSRDSLRAVETAKRSDISPARRQRICSPLESVVFACSYFRETTERREEKKNGERERRVEEKFIKRAGKPFFLAVFGRRSTGVGRRRREAPLHSRTWRCSERETIFLQDDIIPLALIIY